MQRPYKPANVPGLMPYLIVNDPKKSITFYQKAFGFELSFPPMETKGEIVHAEMKLLDSIIMLGPEGTFDGIKYQSPKTLGFISPVGLYVYVTDVDLHLNRAMLNDARIEKMLQNQFYGDRNFSVIDSDGYRWTFGQNVADFDPNQSK